MTRQIGIIIAACILGLAGYHASVADAHTGQIALSCDSVGFNYAEFPNAANTANYSVTVSAGNGSQSGVFSWTGTSFSGSVGIHAVGNSTVTASTAWTADGGGSASETMTLVCQTPPTTTTTPSPPKVCPDGSPPSAGHDGQPGNDDCDHTTTPPMTHTTTTPTTTTVTATTAAPSNETPSASPPTVTKPQLQNVLAKQAATPRVSVETPAGQLPFTGFPIWMLALVGSAALVTGFGIRRLARS
jgi:hypothetical protein